MLFVRRGTLHFTSDVYERYFRDLGNVVLLRDGSDLIVLPVHHHAAGGYVIKLRSASGDRAVQGADFFRDHGIDDNVELTVPAQWSSERAALVAAGVFD
jgi:hypothetical protein